MNKVKNQKLYINSWKEINDDKSLDQILVENRLNNDKNLVFLSIEQVFICVFI
jgi:hypothetical protein